MKSPSPSDIELVRTFVAEITQVFADMAATDHHLERASIADEIQMLIKPDNDNSIVNLARAILDAKIERTVENFIETTRSFFTAVSHAKRAAEATDLVVAQNNQRNLLHESPSIDQASQLQSLFVEFLQAHPPPVAVDLEEAGPSDSQIATAEQAGTTHLET